MNIIECPYCESHIESNVIWCRFCLRVLQEELKLNCPRCNEPILKTDFYCRFCDAKIRNEPTRFTHRDNFEDDDGRAGAPVPKAPKDPPPSLPGISRVTTEKKHL